MGKTFLKETAKLLQEKRRRKRWYRTVISLSLVVALVTTCLLIHPAITMERTPSCGVEEHTHTQECYEHQLICGQEEREAIPATEETVLNCPLAVHEHTDECYDEEGQLICGSEAHAHDDSCYQTVYTEGVEGHTHTDACYQDVLVCQKTEHTHSESCYPPETEAPVPETSAPETTAPETTAPETSAPETAAPETSAPETTAPETSAPETTTPETEAPVTTEAPATEENVTEAPATEAVTEPVTEKTTEVSVAPEACVLTANGIDYTVQVDCSAAAQIPKNATLSVRELKAETTPQEYTAYYQQAEAKVQQQTGKTILYGRLFDIAILVNGTEIQPAVPVTVKITYTSAVQNPEGSEVKAVYFGNVTELLNVRTNEYNRVWSEVTIDAKGLSVFAIGGIGTVQAESEEVETETEETETEVETETEQPETETEVETETEQPATETELETEQVTETETETDTEESEEFMTEEISTEETVTEESETEEVTTEETETEETTVEETETEEAISEESTTEEPVTEEPITEEPITEEPTTEEPLTEESTTEELTTEEATTEETSEEESETEETTEDTAADEPHILTAEGSDYTVQVSYTAEAQIPEEAVLSVREIEQGTEEYNTYYQQAMTAVQESDTTTISFARFFDISFLVDGKEIEPAAPVSVKISYAEAVEVPEEGEVKSVHFGDEAEVLDVQTNETNGVMDEVTFDAESFSVYGIVGTDTSDENARLVVNFYSADMAFATMYVKKKDLTIEEGDFSTVIYDPGVPDVGDGELFKGWHIGDGSESESEYTIETKAYTIDGIRNYIREQITDIKEGDELNIYAMIFKEFSVTYMDEKKVSLGTEQILIPKSESSVNYTVNMAYTPKIAEQAFQGWSVSDGIDHIVGYTEGRKYENGTEITLTGDVVFSVYAPNGHWLIFDENGKGATYNAPQFVKSGEVTSEPIITMTRSGYTFGGWYTDAACTDENEFIFGNELVANTTIYAKWIAAQKANYTVIIWKQNVSGTGYDFDSSITLTGTVGFPIETITEVGSENEAYAMISGIAYKYTGFHLNTYDKNVKVVTEGTSVVNVYYDRTEYTLTFYTDSSLSNCVKTIQARYQENIRSNFPIVGYDGYKEGDRWKPYKDSVWNEVMVVIDTMPSRDVKFYLSPSNNGPREMNYYVEALSGATGTVEYGGKEFTLYHHVTANYNGVTVEDYLDLLGFTKYAVADPDGNKLSTSGNPAYYRTSKGSNAAKIVNFYYTRDSYQINYMDGVYVDGNGNPIDEINRGQIDTSGNILYDADISSYNIGGENYFDPEYQGFVLEGWYSDDKCTQPYTFTTMPQGGVTVYAKWRQIQYRVFLHPNADMDPSLNWGSNDQEMNFRISYGGKISTPTGLRDEYEFVGWYLDETFTKVFSADAFVLNDTTVTAAYDKTTEMTDVMTKWGTIDETQPSYNSDAIGYNGGDCFWITKKLDLYAKWRAKLIGADGINVIYDANGGTNAPTDNSLYLDGVKATAQEAATAPSTSEGEAPKAFKYWVVQTWNEDEAKYEDTDITVYPGDLFTVLKANAKQTENEDSTEENPSYTYTVQLRAEYGDWDTSTKTEIKWHSNTVDVDGNVISGAPTDDIVRIDADLKINEAVNVEGEPANPCYVGYKFLGWARRPNTNELWLKYENGTFTLAGTTTVVTKVAADQLGDLPNDVYALWEKKTYTVTVEKEVSGVSDDEDRLFGFTYTLDGVQNAAGFRLKQGEKTSIVVPYDTVLVLTESNAAEYSLSATGTTIEAGSTVSSVLSITVNDYSATATIKGDATITLTNTRKEFVVDFAKTDKTGNELSGATFSLNRRPLGSSEGTIYAAYDSLTLGKKTLQLISGEYELIENSAPNGHIILTNHIYFSVANNGELSVQKVEFSDGTEIATLESGTSKDSKGTITIKNEPGKELPHTGGSGTLLYTLSGLLLIAIALMYGFVLRRRRERRISG